MTRDERGLGVVNLRRPFDGVLIGSTAEVGEEAKLKVVVRVDEAGEQQISRQINDGCRWRDVVAPSRFSARDGLNVSAVNRDRRRGCGVWSQCVAASPDMERLGVFGLIVRPGADG